MLSLKIAVRFLKYGKTQTILIVLGISIAVSIQIFVGLLIGSLQKSLVDATVGNSPHITILSDTEVTSIRDWKKIIQTVDNLHITKGVAVSASSNAFVKGDNTDLSVILKGFDFEQADSIYNFSDAIYEGEPYRSNREVLIGRELQEETETKIGDNLQIVLSDGTVNTFTIAGFYDLGVAGINKTWILTTLTTTQRILGFYNRVSSIEFTVDDVFTADSVAARINDSLDNEDLRVENWKELNQDLLDALQSQQLSSLIIQAVILISVVIAISSILAIIVLQKSRQIGILKAIGIRDTTASLIFIHQGFIIGLIGSVLGLAMGLGLLYAFNSFTSDQEGTSVIKLYIDYRFIFWSWLIALTSSILAGVIPARKSLQLDPVEVIREG
jgi:lipoprotein-releasing system permease protein